MQFGYDIAYINYKGRLGYGNAYAKAIEPGVNDVIMVKIRKKIIHNRAFIWWFHSIMAMH